MLYVQHPDSTGQESSRNRERYTIIVDAYQLLKDPKSRQDWLRYGLGWSHGVHSQSRPNPNGPYRSYPGSAWPGPDFARTARGPYQRPYAHSSGPFHDFSHFYQDPFMNRNQEWAQASNAQTSYAKPFRYSTMSSTLTLITGLTILLYSLSLSSQRQPSHTAPLPLSQYQFSFAPNSGMNTNRSLNKASNFPENSSSSLSSSPDYSSLPSNGLRPPLDPVGEKAEIVKREGRHALALKQLASAREGRRVWGVTRREALDRELRRLEIEDTFTNKQGTGHFDHQVK